jgi:hypothetical protein
MRRSTANSRDMRRCLIVLLGCWLTSVSGKQSNLKVAACKPGQAPYVVVQENGDLSGFDVGECPIYFIKKVLHDAVELFIGYSQICGTKPTAFSSNEYRRR